MSSNRLYASTLGWTLLLVAVSIGLYTLSSITISASILISPLFTALAANSNNTETDPVTASAGWNAPNRSQINDLDAVIDGTGVYGFIFNDSYAPQGNDYYGGYNWCNMPHVNSETYVKAPDEYVLEYVEVIHRHHKRTPYASNLFPSEETPWDCTNSTSDDPCDYPQLTSSGLKDAHQHGLDLASVYNTLLHFLPSHPTNSTITIRVTNNPLTTQTASTLIPGLFPTSTFPLHIHPPQTDSLEPSYPCPAATALYGSYGVSSPNPSWTAHLTRTAPLFTHLDSISTIPPSDTAWHRSYDHYFDNLSARLCHSLPLPCSSTTPTNCINAPSADQVFRLGEYEYSYLYRDHPLSLPAAAASFGVYVGEVAQNMRAVMGGGGGVRYRHNVAHDGSLARLLAVLQVDGMVWPGMGAEVVFELYRKGEGEVEWYVRVLWGGMVARSSHPGLGLMEMVPVEKVLDYFDELVGVEGEKVPDLCASS